jgi:chromosome segregation ATPase
MHELHAQHTILRLRQELEEARARETHVDVSLPVITLARRYTPRLSASLESLDVQAGASNGVTATSRTPALDEATRQIADLSSRLRTAHETVHQFRHERDRANEELATAREGWARYHEAYEQAQVTHKTLHTDFEALLAAKNGLDEENRTLRQQYDEAKHNAERFQASTTQEARARTVLQQHFANARSQQAADLAAARAGQREFEALARDRTDIAESLRTKLADSERRFKRTQAELNHVNTQPRAQSNQSSELRALKEQAELQRNKIIGLERRTVDLAEQSSRYRKERNRLAREAQKRDAHRGRKASAQPDSGYESKTSVRERMKDDSASPRATRTRTRHKYHKEATSHRGAERRKYSLFSRFFAGCFLEE